MTRYVLASSETKARSWVRTQQAFRGEPDERLVELTALAAIASMQPINQESQTAVRRQLAESGKCGDQSKSARRRLAGDAIGQCHAVHEPEQRYTRPGCTDFLPVRNFRRRGHQIAAARVPSTACTEFSAVVTPDRRAYCLSNTLVA
jgi:hypothetical protein